MQHSYEAVAEQDGNASTTPARCPIDHRTFSQQKTLRVIEPISKPIEYDSETSIWHIHGFEAARKILRSPDIKQAGFNAELATSVPYQQKPPILYQDGKEHQLQRKQTARFFTPKTVSDNYRTLMENLSDKIIKNIKRKKEVDLSRLTMQLAVRVAGEVVGLTDSRIPGMDKRLEAFFESDFDQDNGKLSSKLKALWTQRHMLKFFYLDVKPAIEARKRAPKQDVISHLVAQNSNEADILMECITYGAAGMITTREFIGVAAWHLLEQPELRERYLSAPEEERYEILHEILRLEPIIGNLQRRTTAEITLEDNGQEYVIPNNALISIHLHGANADESIVGDFPRAICPGRELNGNNIQGMLMSFGDGIHRCPGAYIAIQETDIFLTRLLAIKTLRFKQKPKVSWSELVTGYEIRDFLITVA
jgi:cytochrome P450